MLTRSSRRASGRVRRPRKARAAVRTLLPPVWDAVAFFKVAAIVCAGVIGMWTVGSGIGGWLWGKITEPVRVEAQVRAQSDSLLTEDL